MQPDPAQVYTPAEDTFLLLAAAQEEVRQDDRVLEIGTGSGYIARQLAASAGSITATDINPHATALLQGQGIDVLRADLFEGIRGPFDLILFNPPYLPTRAEERMNDWLEYALDGGGSGRDVIARFLAGAGRVLAPGGRILLLISSLTGIDAVTGLAFSHGFSATVIREQVVEDERLYVIRLIRKMD